MILSVILLTGTVAISNIDFADAVTDPQTTWAKTYGDPAGLVAISKSVQQTSDGGYVVAGYVNSFGSYGFDAWVLKLDAQGNVEWQKALGGSDTDAASFVQQTSDGGYIVAGGTRQANGGAWLIKLDGGGNIQWQKGYGGGSCCTDLFAPSAEQTSDEGYIVAGPAGFSMFKLDKDGSVQWSKGYGQGGTEDPSSVHQTSDGGYVLAGGTYSLFGAGFEDFQVLKTDSEGNVQWEKWYGGTGIDHAYSIVQATDGGYVLAGAAHSPGLGMLILKLDSNGNIEWQKAYDDTSGNNIARAESIQQTSDGGYVVAAHAEYTSPSRGALLKLDKDGNLEWSTAFVSGGERLFSVKQTLDGGYIAAGDFNTNALSVIKFDREGNVANCTEGFVSAGQFDPRITNANTTSSTPTGMTTSIVSGNTNATLLNTDANINVQCEVTSPPVQPPVGGEILGTDMTSLFVAGALVNAGWIIPIAGLAAAGVIGFALRKRIKS